MSDSSPAGPNRPPAPRTAVRGPSEIIDHAYQAKSPLRILARLIDRGPWFYATTTIIFVVKNSGQWLVAIFLARLIDSLVTPASVNFTALAALGGTTLLALALNVPVHTWFVVRLSECARSLEQRLRLGVARRLQQLSMSFHQKAESGRLQAKLLRDVEQVQLMTMELGNNGISAVTMLVIATGYTAFTEPLMLGFFLIVAPVSVAISRSFRGAIRTRNHDYRERMEHLHSRTVELVDMMPLARAHGIEDLALDEFTQRVTEVNKNGRLLDRVNALFQSSAWLTFQLFNLAVLGVGYWFVVRGWMSVGDLVVYQAMFNYLVNSINTLLNLYPTLSRGAESLHSLGEVLQSPDLEHNDGKDAPTEVAGRIEFQGVNFAYDGGRQSAISDLDLTIPAGRTVAIVGESGSGKSTLTNILIGFLRPQSGRVLLDGVDMEAIDVRVWRRRLALVPQQSLLFNGTIRENILFGLPSVADEWFHRVTRLTHVDEFVDELPDGMNTRIGERGTTLSGGQKQRIAIARALVRDPRIIVLDEPTSALDAQSERHVQAALAALTHGRTTIIVAHRLSTIRAADTICVLDRGRLIESGTYDELLQADGPFANLHAASQT